MRKREVSSRPVQAPMKEEPAALKSGASQSLPRDPEILERLEIFYPLIETEKLTMEEVLDLSPMAYEGIKVILPFALESPLVTRESLLEYARCAGKKQTYFPYFTLMLLNKVRKEEVDTFSHDELLLSMEITCLLNIGLLKPSELHRYFPNSKITLLYRSIPDDLITLLQSDEAIHLSFSRRFIELDEVAKDVQIRKLLDKKIDYSLLFRQSALDTDMVVEDEAFSDEDYDNEGEESSYDEDEVNEFLIRLQPLLVAGKTSETDVFSLLDEECILLENHIPLILYLNLSAWHFLDFYEAFESVLLNATGRDSWLLFILMKLLPEQVDELTATQSKPIRQLSLSLLNREISIEDATSQAPPGMIQEAFNLLTERDINFILENLYAPFIPEDFRKKIRSPSPLKRSGAEAASEAMDLDRRVAVASPLSIGGFFAPGRCDLDGPLAEAKDLTTHP